MDVGRIFQLTLLLSVLLFVIQRTEARKRFTVALGIFLTVGLLLRDWLISRDLVTEAVVALTVSFVLNFLFWWLIGRYNPVGSSDDIRVLGMDD